MNRKAPQKSDARAFSLIELLVATAVFALLLVGLTEVLSSAQMMVRQGTSRTDADAVVRTISSLIERDLQRAYLGAELPFDGSLDDGDDWLALMTLTPGYEGDRDISWVEYRMRDGRLQRGSRGYKFGTKDDREPADDLLHFEMEAPTLTEDEFQTVSERVLRFELGVIDWSSSSTHANQIDAGASILIFLAIVGDDAVALLDEDGFDALRTLIPSTDSGESPISAWREAVEGAIESGGGGLPLPALQSVRFYQTVVSLSSLR